MTDAAPLNAGLYKVHRVFFIAFTAFAVIMAFEGIVMFLKKNEDAGIGLISFVCIPFAALHWYAAKGARSGAASGRTLSRIIGTFWLLGFPVETFLGIYVWSQTSYDKWKGNL